MDPRDFRKLAESLIVSRNASAVHFRTAIGRAYYASFHVASQALGELGFPPAANQNGHFQVVRLLQDSGENGLATVGGMLGDLHSKRLIADYQLKKLDVETLRRP